MRNYKDYYSGNPVVDAFDTRNGNDCVKIDGFLIFSNGASRDSNPASPLYEPPKNPKEKCRLQVKYWEEMLRRHIREFDSAKNYLWEVARARMNEGLPPPDDQHREVVTMKQLESDVKDCRKRLTKARRKLDRYTPDALRSRKARISANRQANEEFIKSIAGIRV